MDNQLAVYYRHNFVFDTNKVEIDLTVREHINKPMKAFWTSSVKTEEGYISSEWVDFCVYDYHYGLEIRPIKYIFVPKKNLKIYTIDSVEDYLSPELKKMKPLESRYSFDIRLIDYKAMKESGYDGIHFTSNGASLGHCCGDEVPFDVQYALNAIDVESTVWFRPDWFESVTEDDSWFDYSWLSVRYSNCLTEEKWYDKYDESDCGHLLV